MEVLATMSQPSITTSRSILMHTSLAYLSPELRTFDFILRGSFPGKVDIIPPAVRLPTEILLLIRHHLLPTLTTSLFERSKLALAHYQSSLCKLLCRECLLYNQEVYGFDVWGWERFTGACSCRSKSRIEPGHTEFPQIPPYVDLWNEEQVLPNCSSWLELYLSFEYSRLSGCRTSLQSIWDAVQMVLEDHGCQLSDNPTAQPSNRPSLSAYRGIKLAIDIPTPVTIVPTSSIPDAESRSSAPIVLHRTNRDLGLSFAYERRLQIWKGLPRPPPLFHPKPHLSCASTIQSRLVHVYTAITTVVIATVSLPITFVTLALTILCYYSRSHALRIL